MTFTGELVKSFIKHPSSVRGFDFNYDIPSQIYCGCSDGHVRVWNTEFSLRMDDIMPDPEWADQAKEGNLTGWNDVHGGHSGSILCVKIAPNGWLLATGSADNTCKVWNTVSYRKNINQVQNEITVKAQQSIFLEHIF